MSDPKNHDSNDTVDQREEGDDVEAHAYRAAAANADAYRNVDNADAYATEDPPDVEGHAFNVDNVDNVD